MSMFLDSFYTLVVMCTDDWKSPPITQIHPTLN